MNAPGAGYALLMTCALAAGWAAARRSQSALSLTPRQRAGLALGAFAGGMLGAKLPFALAHLWLDLPGSAWLGPGKTILGGLVGGYVGVELAKLAVAVRVKTGDSFAAPVALSVGLGRLACLQAGCCYGRPTALPWGLDFGDGVPRHPAQLYEAAFHLALAALLVRLRAGGLLRRQLFKLYLLAYLAFRFATEFVRPEPLHAGLSAYQWAALGLVPLLAALWAADRPEPRAEAASA